MATIYTHKDANVRKTWFLMAIFLVIVLAIGWYLSYYYENPAIIVIAVIFSVFMNIMSYWQSDKIAIALSGAKPVKREQFPELFRITENLAITSGLPMPRLYVVDDSAPNAFATGRDKEHAAVAVTTGLLGMMDTNELSGVIAHELSHIGNRDILLQTVVVVLVGFIAIISDIFLRGFLGGGRREGKGGGVLAIVGLVLIILSPIVGQLIKLAISRKREFLADADGALLTRYPEGLASALEKIGSYSAPMQRASNATAHLFISNPFGAKASSSWLTKFFMTHPPVGERVRALRGTEIEKSDI